MNDNKMRISRLSRELRGFEIISLTNGQRIGKVEDILIDPNGLQVAAVVTSKAGLLGTSIEAVPRKEIQVWGEDVILVSNPDVIREQKEINGYKDWESAMDQIINKDVLNTKGERIAELEDVVIDAEARIVGYELSNVFMEGPVAETGRIHVNTTQALGADALIIDTSKLYQWKL